MCGGKKFFVGILCLLLANACQLFFEDTMCNNYLVAETASPNKDKKQKAILFTRDCGATTSFSTQISLLEDGEPLANEEGNIFIAK